MQIVPVVKPLRVAQVAPLYESVPPKHYGGTERIVSYLTEELVAQGHDVTLFASGDSETSARLVAVCPRSLRLDPDCIDQLAHHVVLLERVMQQSDAFDIIHFHVDYLHFPLSRRGSYKHVTTMHGRLDIPDLVPLYREFPEVPLVSISDAQREPLPWVNWQGTVYHGLPRDLYRFHGGPGTYLACLGRISPEKGVDRAIAIAKQVGIPLRIAAKVDKADQEYFDSVIEPLLHDPLVEYIGEIGDDDKDEFLGNAQALLFPIDWPEPFGIVMIEAMACGTPVIAYSSGSVPEVMEQGRTGFVVRELDDAVEAVRRVPQLSRARCREVFEERFTAARMAHDYLEVYAQLMAEPALRVA
jgi:glycosyltransferase involved in cell wall biosynthesis